MLELRKIFNSSRVGYWYLPNGKDPGLIEIDTSTGEVYITILSDYDKELGCSYYGNKAKGTVKQLWDKDKNNLPDEKYLHNCAL